MNIKRDEKWFKVFIASISVIKVLLEVEDTNPPSTIAVGNVIKISCLTQRIGQPLSNISLMLNGKTLSSNSPEHLYTVIMEDVGRDLLFSCHWDQLGPGGEAIYSGADTAPPVTVVLPPVITSNISRWEINILSYLL